MLAVAALASLGIPSIGYPQSLKKAVEQQLDRDPAGVVPCFVLRGGDPAALRPITDLIGGLREICIRGRPPGGAGPATSMGDGAATPTTLPSIVQKRLRESRAQKEESKTSGVGWDAVAKLPSGLNLFMSGDFASRNPNPSPHIALVGGQPNAWQLRSQGVMVASSDPTTGPAPVKIAVSPNRVTGIEIQEAASQSAIVRIQADRPVASYNNFVLDNPPRLVIDVSGALMAESMAQQAGGKGPIIRIRASQYRRKPEPVVRVVLNLTSILPYQVAGNPETFRILVGEAVAKAPQAPPALPPPVITEQSRSTPEEVAEAWRNVGVWGSGEYERLNRSVTTFEDGYNSDISRVTVGADYQFTDRFVAGLAFDAYWQSGDFDGGGDFSNNSYGLLAYGSFRPIDQLFLALSAGYARKNYDRTRIATFNEADGTTGAIFFSSTPGPANADHSANEARVSALVGYDYAINNVTISPRAGFDYSHIDFGTYSETGSSGLELTFYDDAQTSLQSRLGVQALVAFSGDSTVIVPQVSFDWKREFKDDQRTVEVSFVHDKGAQRFTYMTNPPDRHWLEINVGVAAVLSDRAQLFGNYRAIVGNSLYDSRAGMFGFRYTF